MYDLRSCIRYKMDQWKDYRTMVTLTKTKYHMPIRAGIGLAGEDKSAFFVDCIKRR